MKSKKIHPLVAGAQEQLRNGLISRRDFLRISTLLGMSVASASILAACGGDENAAVNNNAANNNNVVVSNNNSANDNAAPSAADDDEPEMMDVSRGGTLRVFARIESVDHPARFNLVSQSNPWRQVFEYLSYMDADGIAYPYLLDKWEASEDLLTWTLTLKQGIKFSDGRDFTADDVIFNFGQWLTDADSALKGAMSYVDPNGIEKQDDYTVIVHLQSPSIFLPEHLFSYPAMIVPNGFGGDMVAEPIGTGPFTMDEYAPGDRCVLKARSDYWRTDANNESLPYLDEIVFVQTDGAAALQGGDVDFIAEPKVTEWDALKGGDLTVIATPSASTRVLRMRADQEPWTNNDVRMALKMCHDRDKILASAIMGQGVVGNDSHIAPAQPDYSGVDPLPFDTGEAKNLLTAAGYGDGLDVELAVPGDLPEAVAYAETLKEDAAAAGFNITINAMPAADYWAGWKEWNLGITWWAHRPMAPVGLPFAYIQDFNGVFGPWNETQWADEEFTTVLRDAEGELNLDARRELVAALETIQRDRGSVCIPFFTDVWQIYASKVKNVPVSPEEYTMFTETWLEV